MIDKILEIMMIAMASVWLAELSMVPQWIARMIGRKRVKPFDCPLCLAWWTGLVWFVSRGEGFLALAFAASSSLMAVWVSRKIHE